jgi:hypothetical protein
VNLGKSCVYFGSNCEDEIKRHPEEVIGIQNEAVSEQYLGLPEQYLGLPTVAALRMKRHLR